MVLYSKINEFCKKQANSFDLISTNRKEKLKLLSNYFSSFYKNNKIPKANAICTHNSRRSHFTQVCLAVAATFYDKKMETFSGGTEVTALNINVADTLKNIGFKINFNEKEKNPKFEISWTDDMKPYQAFSKVFDDKINPKKDFVALMVCNSADKNCPIVFGADLRIALPFNDPKQFDGTKHQNFKYLECCELICREMLFVFSLV